jgi:hypothetical protein
MVSESETIEDAQAIATSTQPPEPPAAPAAAPTPSPEAAIHTVAAEDETMPTDQLGLF